MADQLLSRPTAEHGEYDQDFLRYPTALETPQARGRPVL